MYNTFFPEIYVALLVLVPIAPYPIFQHYLATASFLSSSTIFYIIFYGLLVACLTYLIVSSVKKLNKDERGVLLRLGRILPTVKGPGIVFTIPIIDQLIIVKTSPQILKMPLTWHFDIEIVMRIFDPYEYVTKIYRMEETVRRLVLEDFQSDFQNHVDYIYDKLKEYFRKRGVEILRVNIIPSNR